MPGYKQLGPNVSQSPQDTGVGGQFSGEERSYEEVVIQDDAPVIDWEMNLRSDVHNDHGLRLSSQRSAPSAFLDGDFLERTDGSGSFAVLSPIAGNESKLRLLAQNAVMNGWPVRVEYTGASTPGLNVIQLPAPPVAGSRTDLVILEVWRALVRSSPSMANKSATGMVLRLGNAKAPDAVNLTDDLIDPTYANESSARVQIQHRLRTVAGVDLSAYPDGVTDPAVVANTVSDFSGPGADGTATAYVFAGVAGDAGLWRAGTGNAASAAALGTVDGYMYAVPVCAVARRNSAAFDRATNLNGAALIAAGTSDRPDGLFSDQVVIGDLLDMRRGLGHDLSEVLEKAMQQVLDNTLATRFESGPGGSSGTSFLAVESAAAGTSFGLPDGVRRHFSDRAITESVVARIDVGAGVSSVNFRLSSLTLSWGSSPLDLLTDGPSGTTLAGFGRIRVVQSALATDEDMLNPASSIFVTGALLDVFTGPQVDELHLVFNAATTVSTSIYAELLIAYPSGLGTARNMVGAHQLWVRGSLPAWVDGAFLTPTSDADRKKLNSALWSTDLSHRELAVHLQSTLQSAVFHTYVTDKILIWERLDGSPVTINDGINPPYATTNYTANTAYTLVGLTGAVPVPAGTAVTVSYVAFRPLPPVAAFPDDSYDLFYGTNAIQSVPPPAGSQTLKLIPRAVPKHVFVIGTSTGSPDSPFPFAAPGEQVPTAALPAPDFPESRIDGPADIGVPGFGSNTGFLQLPVHIPYVPNPGQVSLYRNAPDVVLDAEGRSFWPKSDTGSPSVYSPVVFGPELDSGRHHKVCFPILAELKEDFLSVGRKGSIVLVVLTNWLDFDPQNGVVLTPVAGTSGGGVFRTRGNLLNPRRPNY